MIAIDEVLRIPDLPIHLGWIRGRVVMAFSGDDPVDYAFVKGLDYKEMPAIKGGRRLYRHFRKDPTRYRLSSEGLIRRIQRDKPLYRINRLGDLMNHYSIITGRPLGLYDFEKIQGEIVFSLGRATDSYEGVGRGDLNIADLPVLRDEAGAFGSATSDSARTATSLETREILLVIYAFADPLARRDLEELKAMMADEIAIEALRCGIATT